MQGKTQDFHRRQRFSMVPEDGFDRPLLLGASVHGQGIRHRSGKINARTSIRGLVCVAGQTDGGFLNDT